MYSRFVFPVVIIAILASCSAADTSKHAESGQPPTGAPIAFIGPPGKGPSLASHPVVSAYGAFTFSSPENYCHMVRWIVSGTVLPQYADEPKPVPYQRGTKVRVDGKISTDCTTSGGGSLDVEDATLDEVTVLPNQQFAGETRFILPSDLHSLAEYTAYAVRQHRAVVEARQHSSAIIEFKDAARASYYRCETSTAENQINSAQRFYRARNYGAAQRLAGSAAMYVGACHDSDHIDRIDGDAYLIMGKAMLARGNSDGTKYAFAASMDFMNCGNPEEYPDDYQYCRNRYSEADKIAHPNGT